MGREFRVEVLEAVGELDEDELDEVIEESVDAHVIAEVPGVYGRCSFTHALIRQTLYDGLTATRRARLHLRVGGGARAAPGRRAEPPLAELAYHFSLAPPARGAPRAVEYAERAAQRAAAVLAYEEAARLYAVALRRARAGAAPTPSAAAGCCSPAATPRPRRATRSRRTATFRQAADTARALGSAQLLGQAALGYGASGQMAGGIVDDELVEPARGGARGGRRRRPGAALAARRRGSRSSSASPRRATAAPSSAARRSSSRGRSATRAASASRSSRATGRCGGRATCRSGSRRPTTCSASRRARATSGWRARAIAGG